MTETPDLYCSTNRKTHMDEIRDYDALEIATLKLRIQDMEEDGLLIAAKRLRRELWYRLETGRE